MRFLEFIKFNNIFKNFLIFIPLLVAGKQITLSNLSIFCEAFIIFFFLTTCCYIVNNFTDRKIDKKNILKKNKYYPDDKEVSLFLLGFFLLFIISVFYFKRQSDFLIYLYIANFILYNFFLKQKFIFDILLLSNFYLIRLFYGIEIFELSFSSGFFLFFVTLFLSLSFGKRIIQINVNNLLSTNLIIPYSKKYLPLLKVSFICFLSANYIIFLFFFLQNLFFFSSEINFFLNFKEYNYLQIISIAILYSLLISRLSFFVLKDLIKKDIYEYFLKDKVTNTLLFFTIITLVFYN